MPRRSAVVHSNLRLLDLAPKSVQQEVLLSIRLPNELLSRLDRLCLALGARKSEVVTATLNEGLDRFDEIMGEGNSRRRARKVRPMNSEV